MPDFQDLGIERVSTPDQCILSLSIHIPGHQEVYGAIGNAKYDRVYVRVVTDPLRRWREHEDP